MIRRIPVVMLVLLAWRTAGADPYVPQAIIPVDDVRSGGPVARDVMEPEIGGGVITGPTVASGVSGEVDIGTFQINLGPPTFTGQYGDLFGVLNRYALLVKGIVVRSQAASGSITQGGPLTILLQRYAPLEPIDIVPLLHVHVGFEATVATPWLSRDAVSPPPALQDVAGVDSELVQSGWSLRPFSPYVRGDFLACRSEYVEAGVAPEVFVAHDHATQYDARFHVGLGFSLSCAHEVNWTRHVAVLGEYRGRVRAYASDIPVGYFDAASVALQVDVPSSWMDVTVQAFTTRSLSTGFEAYALYGVRVQLGFEKRNP